MKKRLLKFTTAVFILTLLVSSCKKDDDKTGGGASTGGSGNIDKDKAAIGEASSELVNCIGNLQDGKFGDAIEDMTGINAGETNPEKEEWIEQVLDSLVTVLDFEEIEDNERFSLSDYAGNYTYSNSTKSWTKTTNSEGKLVMSFPTESTLMSNDMKFVINGYSDELRFNNGTSIGYPKSADVELFRNNEKIMSVSLSGVEYEPVEDAQVPVNFNLSVFITPFTFDLELDKNSSTSFTGSYSITDGMCKLGAEATLELENDDLATLFNDGDNIDKAKGNIYINELKVLGEVEVDELAALDDPSANQLNSLTNFSVENEGVKIADLVFYDKTDTVYNDTYTSMNVIYSDGSKEDIEDAYYNLFIEDLEAEIADWTGDID